MCRLPNAFVVKETNCSKNIILVTPPSTSINVQFFKPKVGNLNESQSSAEQPEICKTRRHKHEQTENKRKYKKPTNKFACSSLTRKAPVQDRLSLQYLHNVRPAYNSIDAFHTPRSAQVTHDAPPPHCQTLGPILCRRICRSQHQPSCSEPIPTYRMTHTS